MIRRTIIKNVRSCFIFFFSFFQQRVKNPPIRLKDFASVDSMREEINEVVAFLRNPSAFTEMGARAPRVLCSLYCLNAMLFLLSSEIDAPKVHVF